MLKDGTYAAWFKTPLGQGTGIAHVAAEFFSGGTSMARASCQLLRKTENAAGNVWSPSNWDAPAPSDIPTPTDPRLGMNGKWTTRPIVGAMGSLSDFGDNPVWSCPWDCQGWPDGFVDCRPVCEQQR